MRSEKADARDATTTSDWVRLCELLDDDPLIRPEVERAAQPNDDADPWMALIDGLDDAGALAYLDPDDSGVELVDALSQLPRIVRAGIDLDPVGDVDGDLTAAIVVADGILAGHELTVIHLEEDDDAYPLVVVPRENAADAIALARRLGQAARAFS